jgi:beta-galactosidase
MSEQITFGVDYYPEHWRKTDWEADASAMRKMGITAVRMMENAWAVIQPKEDVFDFSLFDEAVEVFTRHQIHIVLGTPTATIPAWLYVKDPDLVQVHPDGIRKDFGTRRIACMNSTTYLNAMRQCIRQIGTHFGNNPHVIGWQIDNEVGHEGTDRCICQNCKQAWHEWLARKYENVEKLNQEWGTVFWSTTYSDFHQVPLHRKQIQTIQNPGLRLDYDRFCSDTAVVFMHEQVEILKKYILPSQWVSTNLYFFPHSSIIDMQKAFKKLDLVGASFYPVWGDADAPVPYYALAYYLSYLRGLKPGKPITIFEQFTNIQGHQRLGYLPSGDENILWTNMAIAHGANRVFYFRWRTAPFGQEQLCYGIRNADNMPTKLEQRIENNITTNRDIFSEFSDFPIRSEACLVYEKDNSRIVKEQSLSKGFELSPNEYMQIGYDMEMARYFAPFSIFNIPADVRSVDALTLEQYKIVCLPVYQITDRGFVRRLEEWVEKGGVLILGWRSGTRDERNWAVNVEPPGEFSKLVGSVIKGFESLNLTKVKTRIRGVPFQISAGVWADLLEPTTSKVISWYSDRKKHYKGTPCVTVNRYGKGCVYYIGTSFDPLGLFFLFRKIFHQSRIKTNFKGLGVESIIRETENGGLIQIIMNHTSKCKFIGGKIVQPFQTVFIKKEGKAGVKNNPDRAADRLPSWKDPTAQG